MSVIQNWLYCQNTGTTNYWLLCILFFDSWPWIDRYMQYPKISASTDVASFFLFIWIFYS